MSKVLFILNTFYPFSRQEDFLANEMQLVSGFKKIVVFPNSISSKDSFPLYKLPANTIFVKNKYPYKKVLGKCIWGCLFNKAFYYEIIDLICSRRFTISRFRYLLSFMLYSENSYNTVSDYIKTHNITDEIVVYSYWLHTSAFVGCCIKNKFHNVKAVVSRCHRFDLYEYANEFNYIPQRKFILSNLDEIYSISEHGIRYLNGKYPDYVNKYKLYRLGTFDRGMSSVVNGNVLRIVSCSWMRRVKRIHRIFESIKDATYPIEWTHFGDGETFEEIKKLVDSNNNSNVNIILAGNTRNDVVIESYVKNSYDIFVNVSENEGVPVSIMEAMSCGLIPVATDVGGTGELIDNELNGFLMPRDFKNCQLKGIIDRIYKMSSDEKKQIKKQARDKWEQEYNALKNYKTFYAHLNKI